LCSFKDISLVVAVRLGPEISFRAFILSTGNIQPHCHALVVNPALNIIYRFPPRDPQDLSRSKKPGEHFRSFLGHRQFHFLVPQNVRVPETVPQNARWECRSTLFGTVVTTVTFWQPEDLSEPPACQSKHQCTSLVYHSFEFHQHRPR
jgi:hypothetical protein